MRPELGLRTRFGTIVVSWKYYDDLCNIGGRVLD